MFLAARAAPPPTEIDRRAAADTMTSAHSSTRKGFWSTDKHYKEIFLSTMLKYRG